jgi:hypothetical protein
MKKYCFYVITLNVFLLVSCVNKENSPDKGFVIKVPKHIELYNQHLSDSLHQNITLDTSKQQKIYTTINVSCATCLQKFEKWDRFHSELGELNNNLVIIPMCYSEDKFESLKFLFENNKLPPIKIPLALDVDNSFVRQNLSLWKKHGDFTVLTDSKNNVLLVGDPIGNEKDKNKFIQAIRNKKI